MANLEAFACAHARVHSRAGKQEAVLGLSSFKLCQGFCCFSLFLAPPSLSPSSSPTQPGWFQQHISDRISLHPHQSQAAGSSAHIATASSTLQLPGWSAWSAGAAASQWEVMQTASVLPLLLPCSSSCGTGNILHWGQATSCCRVVRRGVGRSMDQQQHGSSLPIPGPGTAPCWLKAVPMPQPGCRGLGEAAAVHSLDPWLLGTHKALSDQTSLQSAEVR